MNETHLLTQGIQALKNGQREEARKLLMKVLEQEEDNERAWLWLSGAVDSDEDRRICLENVLTLNPNNDAARKGLAKLGPEPLPTPHQDTNQLESTIPDWSGSVLPQTNQPKKYDDVWETSEDICAFCAHPVDKSDKRCPKCNHKLTTKVLENAVPSKHYRILLTLFMIYNVTQYLGVFLLHSVTHSWAMTLLALIFAIPTTLFTAGLYFRQAWAYWLLVIAQVLQLGTFIFSNIAAPAPPPEVPPFLILLCLSPFLLLQLFIYYTIFMAGADFRKVKVWQIASVGDKPKDAAQYDRFAKTLAKKGMWASAILHWQRAVGRSSGHAGYHLQLAKAYHKLGFDQRSLDSLKAAQEKTYSEDFRQDIQKEIAQIQKSLESKLSMPK
jgi:tetratricopeptide (TPR) repeat protein